MVEALLPRRQSVAGATAAAKAVLAAVTESLFDNGGNLWSARGRGLIADVVELSDANVTGNLSVVQSASGGLLGRNGQTIILDGVGQYGQDGVYTLSNVAADGTSANLSDIPPNGLVNGYAAIGSNQGALLSTALAFISSHGGGTLLLEPGGYLTAQQITLAANVTIAGAGRLRTTLHTAGITNNAFHNPNGETEGATHLVGFAVRDLKVRGSNQFFESPLGISQVDKLALDHVWVDNGGFAGIRMNDCADFALSNIWVSDQHTSITSTNLFSGGMGIYVTYGSSYGTATNLLFDGIDGNAFQVEAGHRNPNQGDWAKKVIGVVFTTFSGINICRRDGIYTNIPQKGGAAVGPITHTGAIQFEGCQHCRASDGVFINVGTSTATTNVQTPLFTVICDQSASLAETKNNVFSNIIAYNVTGALAVIDGAFSNDFVNIKAHNILSNGLVTGASVSSLSIWKIQSTYPQEPSFNPGAFGYDTADNRFIQCEVYQEAGQTQPNFWVYYNAMTQRSSTLSGGINSAVTTIVIGYNANFPTWGYADIDVGGTLETISWDSITQNVGVSTTLNTVQRGLNGTAAAAHLTGVAIVTHNLRILRNRVIGGKYPVPATGLVTSAGDVGNWPVTGVDGNQIENLEHDDLTYGGLWFGASRKERISRGVANGFVFRVNDVDAFQAWYSGSVYALRPKTDMGAQLGEANTSRWAALFMAGPDGTGAIDLKSTTASSTQSPRIVFRDNQATSKKILMQKSGNYLRILEDGGATVVSLSGTSGVATILDSGADIRSPIGFFSTTPTTKQTVTGSRGGNAALASLLTALAAYGLVTDSSTA